MSVVPERVRWLEIVYYPSNSRGGIIVTTDIYVYVLDSLTTTINKEIFLQCFQVILKSDLDFLAVTRVASVVKQTIVSLYSRITRKY